MNQKILVCCTLLCMLVCSLSVNAQNAKENAKPRYHQSVPIPTYADVPYGKHERHMLDFWQTESDLPTPVVFVIHGGGWQKGSMEIAHKAMNVNVLLEAKISVMAINYRLLSFAQNVVPPVKAPMYDAARALQFVRNKAKEWNIDKARIGLAGISAGACTSLWLTYHDDLADISANNPVARESTKPWCAAVISAQTTLDPKLMIEWTPNSKYGGHAFGFSNKDFAGFLSKRDSLLLWINEYSPYSLVSKDDPRVFLYYRREPAMGEDQQDPTHSANFGVKMQERCTELEVGCTFFYPGVEGAKYKNLTEYLVATLNATISESQK